MLEESGGGLSCQMEYSTDLFDASTIERMFRHYQAMLEGIIIDPDQRLSNLQLLTPTEKRQILVEWIATHKAYPQDLSIVQRFESRAAENPEATAFICGSERLSYGELNQRANRLAHHLQSLGVGPEVLVGICLERSLSFVTALLGVFKAGGAYLPLDPSYPQERLGFMLKDSGASVLLTEENLSSMFSAHDLRLVCLDADCETIAMQSQENPTNDVSASNLAYVIYTSGSTGKPKGVAVEHKQLLNRFFWMWEMYPFEADEVGCQKTALNFVDSIWELLGPVLCGVPTVIIPERVMQDPERLVNTLAITA
jgi:non-ribosomal peptide synthetase component F